MRNIRSKLTKTTMGVLIAGLALGSSCCSGNFSQGLIEGAFFKTGFYSYLKLNIDFSLIFMNLGGVDLLLVVSPDQIPDTVTGFREMDQILEFEQFAITKDQYESVKPTIDSLIVVFYADNKRAARAFADNVSYYYLQHAKEELTFNRLIDIHMTSEFNKSLDLSAMVPFEPAKIEFDSSGADSLYFQPQAKVNITCYQSPFNMSQKATAEIYYSFELKRLGEENPISKRNSMFMNFVRADSTWQMISSNKKLSDLLEEE